MSAAPTSEAALREAGVPAQQAQTEAQAPPAISLQEFWDRLREDTSEVCTREAMPVAPVLAAVDLLQRSLGDVVVRNGVAHDTPLGWAYCNTAPWTRGGMRGPAAEIADLRRLDRAVRNKLPQLAGADASILVIHARLHEICQLGYHKVGILATFLRDRMASVPRLVAVVVVDSFNAPVERPLTLRCEGGVHAAEPDDFGATEYCWVASASTHGRAPRRVLARLEREFLAGTRAHQGFGAA